MLKTMLLTQESTPKDLVNHIKNELFEVYEEIYKSSKDVILNCIMNDNQDELLKVANKLLIPKRLKDKLNGDMRFYEFNKQAINEAIDNDLDLANLSKELEVFIQKVSLISDNEKMSYEEIMSYDYDEDFEIYKKDFNLMLKLVKTIRNLYLYGNAGNGKTTFAYKVAEALNLKLYNINSVKNEYSVKGFYDLDGKYNLSLYEKWYKNGGVLLLDEVDTYNANGMLYLNQGIEINSDYMTLDNGEVIHKHKDCYVIACANTKGDGKTHEYIGRNAIDKAFLSRFSQKEFKEYAYIHKQILKDDKAYRTFKRYFDKKGVELTCRTCVKLKNLLTEFNSKEIIELIDEKVITL